MNKDIISENRKIVDYELTLFGNSTPDNKAVYKYETPYNGMFEIKHMSPIGAVILNMGPTVGIYIMFFIKPYKYETNVNYEYP